MKYYIHMLEKPHVEQKEWYTIKYSKFVGFGKASCNQYNKQSTWILKQPWRNAVTLNNIFLLIKKKKKVVPILLGSIMV